MVNLTPIQSIRLFGWRDPRPILVWDDVLRLRHSFDTLIGSGLRVSELVLLQPDPSQWVAHAGAGLGHARAMIQWPANPFIHLGADLGDVLKQRFTAHELVSMDVSYGQMVKSGMTARTEQMFRFSADEWAMLGKTV
jgi:hypothetical protein